jgi:hypothetical protein
MYNMSEAHHLPSVSIDNKRPEQQHLEHCSHISVRFPLYAVSKRLRSVNRQGEIKVMSGVQSTPVWSILMLLSTYNSYMNMLVIFNSA